MSLKHLLVHVDGSERTAERLGLALTLSKRFGARLTGLFAESGQLGPSIVARRNPEDVARVMAGTRASFEARAAAAGVEAEWWQIEEADYADIVGWTVRCTRYADLAIFGQHEHQAEGERVPADLVDQVLRDGGRPVLVVPSLGRYPDLGKRVLVAWTGSREAARALNDALPFLERADEVLVLSIQRPSAGEGGGRLPPVHVLPHLRAHGIEARYERAFTEETSVADQVLNRAADFGADLTVMGAHEPGGLPVRPHADTTRDLLKTMTTPMLLSR
jgi:nucleotide-binding universal stress UspA family protein